MLENKMDDNFWNRLWDSTMNELLKLKKFLKKSVSGL